MNEHSSTSSEGSAATERAEEVILGHDNHQKIEVVHRFADEHPLFHPLLAVGVIAIAVCVAFFLRRYWRK